MLACADMSTQELMAKGRLEMKAQEDSLARAQRIVESTIEVGTKTAETLHQQGEQMERVLDALEEIKFSMKKANQVIRDITRSIATDKCALLHDLLSLRDLWQLSCCSLTAAALHAGTKCKALTSSAWRIALPWFKSPFRLVNSARQQVAYQTQAYMELLDTSETIPAAVFTGWSSMLCRGRGMAKSPCALLHQRALA